jgi:hypothetical protein
MVATPFWMPASSADVARFADLDGENPLFQCLEPFGQLKSDEEGTDHLACGIAYRDVMGDEVATEHQRLAGVGVAGEQRLARRVIGAERGAGGPAAVLLLQ